MKNTTTKFYIEVNENGNPKIVPHDDKNNYFFIIQKTARTFLKKLIKSNPGTQFRLVTLKMDYYRSAWESIPGKKVESTDSNPK